MGVRMHHPTIQAALDEAGQEWADRVGRRVVNAVRRECPRDEGALAASFEHISTPGVGQVTVVVGSPLHYAEYHQRGTGIYGPHGTPIVPVSASALKFRWAGPGSSANTPVERRPWVFAKSVRGIPANPFLTRALIEVLAGFVTRTRSQ